MVCLLTYDLINPSNNGEISLMKYSPGAAGYYEQVGFIEYLKWNRKIFNGIKTIKQDCIYHRFYLKNGSERVLDILVPAFKIFVSYGDFILCKFNFIDRSHIETKIIDEIHKKLELYERSMLDNSEHFIDLENCFHHMSSTHLFDAEQMNTYVAGWREHLQEQKGGIYNLISQRALKSE